jgi:Rap1a immunity proteins
MYRPRPSAIHARVRRRTERALRIFLAVAFMTVSTVRADAKFLDGNTLYGWCLSEDVGDQEACLGYVVGVADMLSSEADERPERHRACIPDIEANQAVSTVKQYLRVHPRTDVANGSDLAAAALSEAFPCP